MNEEELAKVKEAVNFCLMNGEYLKAHIIPITDLDSPFCGEYHVITEGGGRDCFKTHEAACLWASAYFMAAAAMPDAATMRRQPGKSNEKSDKTTGPR